MTAATLSDTFSRKSRLGVIFLLVVASFVLPHIPLLNLVTLPLQSFTTTIHEMGHAIACLMTGGQVSGMSIVADGQGHGGLTFCQGGIPFIYTQAGYLMTALAGCGMIWAGYFPRLSKGVLVAIGGAFIAASLVFMSGTILHGDVVAGFGSMALSLALGGGIIWTALKLNPYWANLLLLFLGIQTGLNAINDDITLFMQATGMMGQGWSDATLMQQMTAIPAPVWATLWTVISLGLLWATMSASIKLDNEKAIKTI